MESFKTIPPSPYESGELKNWSTSCSICTDIGAPRSVIGVKQVNRIFNSQGARRPALKRSNHRFRFADSVLKSLGIVTLPLKTPHGQKTIDVELDVVATDIPALLGMDLLDRKSRTPCTVTNRLVKRIPDDNRPLDYIDLWHVPLER